jgi:hypothetical protein
LRIVLRLDDLAELLAPDAIEEWSVLAGRDVLAVDLDGGRWSGGAATPLAALPCLKVGVASGPDLSAAVLAGFDVLLTTGTDVDGGWVAVDDPLAEIERLAERVRAQPRASVALVSLLRLTEALPVWEGVVAESSTYSMLLGSEAFLAWRAATPRKGHAPGDPATAVLIGRDGDELHVELNRPEVRNAVDRSVRDGVVAAMGLVLADPTIERVVLTGRGPSFSAGGDLDEFGTVGDPALANAVRLTRHPGYAVARVADRVEARVHGACMGSGIEIPAFAHRVVASPDSVFGLPELGMGLVPGAGGTVSVTKRMGRHRTNWLVISGARIDAVRACAWGLVDALT